MSAQSVECEDVLSAAQQYYPNFVHLIGPCIFEEWLIGDLFVCLSVLDLLFFLNIEKLYNTNPSG